MHLRAANSHKPRRYLSSVNRKKKRDSRTGSRLFEIEEVSIGQLVLGKSDNRRRERERALAKPQTIKLYVELGRFV
jgi:hypothetical protein